MNVLLLEYFQYSMKQLILLFDNKPSRRGILAIFDKEGLFYQIDSNGMSYSYLVPVYQTTQTLF